MPVISRFYGILIKMFFGYYAPSHFHAEYNEHKVLIAIEDFRIIEGWLPPKALGLVIEWACLHKEELQNNWITLSEAGNGQFQKIEPLK